VVGQGPDSYCAGAWATIVGALADDGLPIEVEFECPQAALHIASIIASANLALPALRTLRARPPSRIDPSVPTPDILTHTYRVVT